MRNPLFLALLPLLVLAGCHRPAARARTARSLSESTATPGREAMRSWRLAFVRNGDIWLANGDGSGQYRVIPNAQSPAWSPDRKRIAFARQGNVWVANGDGSNQRQVTFLQTPIDREEPGCQWRRENAPNVAV